MQVGDGATQQVGSDRYPYTVVEILSPKRVVLQRDSYRRTDNNGLSESQEYEYERNPEGSKVTVSLRKNGRWYQVGQPIGGGAYHIGHRSAYQDPSF